MNEKQLQHKVVMYFGQKYPECRGMLWEVNNDTNHGASRMAMGLVKGVADLNMYMPKKGKLIGIELKAKGSRHAKLHIEEQLLWGIQLFRNGGLYIMSEDYQEVVDLIDAVMEQRFDDAFAICAINLSRIADKVDESGKTVLF